MAEEVVSTSEPKTLETEENGVFVSSPRSPGFESCASEGESEPASRISRATGSGAFEGFGDVGGGSLLLGTHWPATSTSSSSGTELGGFFSETTSKVASSEPSRFDDECEFEKEPLPPVPRARPESSDCQSISLSL